MAFSRTVAITVTHTKTLLAPSTGSADKVYGADYVASNSHTGSGTGAVAGATSGGIPYFDSATTENTSALLTAGSPVLGGGSGAAPKTDAGFTSTGTGATFVATLNGMTVTAAPTFSALTQYRIPVTGVSGLIGDSAGLTFGGAAAGTGLSIAAGTATTDVSAISATQTWNNAGVTFSGAYKWSITDQAGNAGSAAGSLHSSWLGGTAGTTGLMALTKTGALNLPTQGNTGITFNSGGGVSSFGIWQGFNSMLYFGSQYNSKLAMDAAGCYVLSNGRFNFSSSTTDPYATQSNFNQLSAGVVQVGTTAANASGTIRAAVQSVAVAGTSTGLVTTSDSVVKNVTGIADNSATATFTVTIPNAAHSASINFSLCGAAGAGGAIGADEFSALVSYDCVVTRTAGVNAVATLSSALFTAITASVAGGATPTISAVLSGISGAAGAINTFTLNVTIHAITGASTNHTCLCEANITNANATGITIA